MTHPENWQTRFRDRFQIGMSKLHSEAIESFISEERQLLIEEAVELGEGLKYTEDQGIDAEMASANEAITAYQEKLNNLE